MISVIWGGMPLLVKDLVANELGMRPLQRVSDDIGWKIITLNAAVFAADMRLREAAGEKDIPDVSCLEEQLKRIRGFAADD